MKVGGYVRSCPAVVNGCVYVGSGDHDIFCFNATDGTVIWRHPMAYRSYSSPAISNGMLYIAADNFLVYALNATTGNEIWHIHTSSTQSSPAIYNGCLYIGGYLGEVWCLNATTGQKIWLYLTGDTVSSSPTVANGCVYVGSYDNNLYCLNATNGLKIWQSPTGYWIVSSPTVADDNVYVGSEDYSIYCFNASTGAKEWSYATGNIVDSSPAVADNTLYIGSFDYNVYAIALNSTSGQSLPLQLAAPAPWTTIAFDAIACAIAAATIGLFVYFIRTERREKKAQPASVSGEKQPWYLEHAEALCLLAILAFSMLFIVYLGSGTLWAADEQTYSQWAYYMYKTGDYLRPVAFGQSAIWIGKPPLLMWLMSIAYQVLGVSNFSSRIWTPFFGFLSLVLVFYLGKKLYNMYVGLASAIVLGTFTTYFMFVKAAMTDVPLVCFMLASIYFAILTEKPQHTSRNAALSGVFFGLALMTKQAAALLIPLVIVVYFIVTQKSLRFLFSKRFALFLGIGVVIFVPWLVAMAASYGGSFWQWFLIYCGIQRTLTPLEGHVGGPLFYFTFLATSENPLWVILLPFATGLCIYNVAVKRLKADMLVLIWIIAVLGAFTVAQTKIYWYILPAYPAFALAISAFLYQLAKRLNLQRFLHPQKTVNQLIDLEKMEGS